MEAHTKFLLNSKLVSLDDKACKIKGDKTVTCAVVESCLKYTGVNVPGDIGKCIVRDNCRKISKTIIL